jgi:hypothetical protein
MLPPEMELQEPQSKEWPLIPADVYQTEITNIEYKEIDNRWKKEPTDPDKKQIMNFEFTIIEVRQEDVEADGSDQAISSTAERQGVMGLPSCLGNGRTPDQQR